MFGISGTELMIILIIALILIGPKDLPPVARSIGKTIRSIQKAGDDLRETIERELDEVKKPFEAPDETVPKDQMGPPARNDPPPAAPAVSPTAAPPPEQSPAPADAPKDAKSERESA